MGAFLRALLKLTVIFWLLVWIGACALWVRSFYVGDAIMCQQLGGFNAPNDHGEISKDYNVVSWKGRLRLEYWENEDRGWGADDSPTPVNPSTHFRLATSLRTGDVETSRYGSFPHEYAGFTTGDEFYRGAHAESRLKYVSVPGSVFIIPLTILSLPALLLIPRFRRLREGFCFNCGYDLRGSKDRCPECGEMVPGHASAVGAAADQKDSTEHG
jgi:hypothetical protein